MLLVVAALFATTIIVSYLAYSRYRARGSKAGIASIAVLPFANQTGDPNAEYLSDGISESLINSLSQVPGVKVIARSSAFKYKGKEADLQEVANALGVEAILTGRLTQRGENLSISVELVNASDKSQMWGEQYERKMSDLLEIQREIAREITEKLKLKVSGDENGPAKHYTESNEAYQLYLKGRFFWNKRTAEALRKSIEYFNQAIDKDPTSHWLTPAWLTAMWCRPTSYHRARPCLKLRRQRCGPWNLMRRWLKHMHRWAASWQHTTGTGRAPRRNTSEPSSSIRVMRSLINGMADTYR